MTEKPEGEVMPTDENHKPEGPFATGSELDALVAKALHMEPSADSEAAKHGARKFHARFADAEVMNELDRAAVPGAIWSVSVHTVIPGDLGDNGRPVLRHWKKVSDNLSHVDAASCAVGFAELVARSIPMESIGEMLTRISERVKDVFNDRKRQAEVGIFGEADKAPDTFANEED